MRKRLLLVLALAVLVTSTLVGCSGASPTDSTLTIFSITEGTVLVMKAGTDDWTEARAEMPLEVGDVIKTGDDSGAEITFFDGSTIELEAGTQIEITSLDTSPDTGTKTITLMQTLGTTISRVTKLLDPASSYDVETPTGVAAVRGSVLVVRILEDGTVLIANLEGHIYFIGHGEEVQIPEGTQVVATNETAELVELSLAVDDSVITDEDTPVTVAAPGVLENDAGLIVGDTLTVTAVDTSGTAGAVTWSSDGSFTYDPDGQFEGLEAGNSTTDSFTYTMTDDYGITDTATVTVTINGVYDVPPYTPPPYYSPPYYPPVNHTPTAITLDNSSVAENQPVNATVGAFSTTDPDTGNTFTYVLASGTGDTDNGCFNIAVTNLRTSASFDYETQNSYSIRVRSTDQGGLWVEKEFTVTATDINETPTDISLSSSTVAESQPVSTIVGAFSTADADTSDTFTYTLVSGNGSMDNSSFNINGSNLRTSAIFDYEAKSVYSIRVRSTDQGGLWVEREFTITVSPVGTPAAPATLHIQIDTGAHASIYIKDDTTDELVTNGDQETSATIPVSGGHSYSVWLGGNVTYYVKHVVPTGSGWEIKSDGQTAYGDAAPGADYIIHFTSNP
jgi:VCBS repeat-containing protein